MFALASLGTLSTENDDTLASPLEFTVGALLAERPRTTLYRGVLGAAGGGRPVVVKMLRPGPDANHDRERLERECGIAQLIDSDGVVKAWGVGTFRDRPALLVEDFGATSLDHVLDELRGQPLRTAEFLPLAIRIARALADVHRAGVIHKDIKPSNILVRPETGEVKISDFGIAAPSPRAGRPALTGLLATPTGPVRTLEGTLAYISPEQTGRMNRSMDHRADLYSLGVTFYQMLTGALPFHAADSLEWIHCHIARTPRAPSDVAPDVPRTLSNIVLKLMAKVAEDRYQSAHGLAADLERCRTALAHGGRIEPFLLGADDVSEDFHIPQRLYGRERETAAIRGAFDRVVQSGAAEILLVSGYSGVGKSSLVRELHEPIVRERGLFVAGKFDQYRRHVPCSAIAQAVGDLVHQLLAEPPDRLAAWTRDLRAALGGSGRVITDLVPDVELLIGPQNPVSPLGPGEAQNRFNLVFQSFVRAVARPAHPIALFLDDLQWADAASLDLIRTIWAGGDIGPLLLVCAYRDNEVDRAHPFSITMEAIRAGGARVGELLLLPLDEASVGAIVSDSLHAPPAEAAPLAALVAEKTQGNPFFVGEFLKTLYLEGLLRFDAAAHTWRWSQERIEAQAITDNVVHLMIDRLRRLPRRTEQALRLASCIGGAFDLELLLIVNETPLQSTAADLHEAIAGGLIVAVERGRGAHPAPAGYRFQHDRIQQAAYALIDDADKPAMHLRIGRLLRRGLEGERLADKLFDVVDQLDAGITLLTDPDERADLSRLNAAAAGRAKASTAYASAARYLATAAALLPDDAWSAAYETTFALHTELAECEYLSGQLDRARARFTELLDRARADLDRARILYLQVKLFQVAGSFEEATSASLRSFELFGLDPPATDEAAARAFEAEDAAVRALLASRIGAGTIADLIDAPRMSDRTMTMIADLLEASGPPLYMVKPALFPWIAVKLVHLSLLHGNAEASCYGYGIYAILLAAAMNDVESGHAFASLAIRLNERLADVKLKGCMLHLLGDHVNFWKHHVATDLPILEKGFLACLEGGDLIYSNYIGFQSPWHLYESGAPLDEVLALTEKYAAFALQSRYLPVHRTIRLEQQFVYDLKGLTRERGSLDGDSFREADAIAEIRAAKFGCGVVYYHVLKLVSHYTWGDYRQALEHANLAEKDLSSAFSMPMEITYHLYRALTLAALFEEGDAGERAEWLSAIEAIAEKMRRWSEACPENFTHKHALVTAEIARITGRATDAMRVYEQAIASAREHRFVQYEALGCELAARLYRRLGVESVAASYLQRAHALYARWGALAKAARLGDQIPGVGDVNPTWTTSTISPSSSSGIHATQLDLVPVVKASQSISGEMILPVLLERLMEIVIESAGAQSGHLVLFDDGGPVIAAQADVDQARPIAFAEPVPLSPSTTSLPLSIVHYVQRTGARVLLDDATVRNTFSSDAYVSARRPRSILCLPITRKGKLTGLLYLENNLVAGAFNADRLAVLELLAAQIAISIDNSRLYQASQDAIQERDQFLAIASHELRTPLTPLKFQLQSLMRVVARGSIADVSPERLARFMDVADRQLNRIDRVVDGLVDVSRFNEGRLELRRGRVDLAALARDVVERQRAELSLARCEVELDASSPAHGHWDAERLSQVFVALLSNTMKHAPGRTIFVGVRPGDERVRITIGDLVAGQVRDEAWRTFDRYERLPSWQHGGGLGLGLFLSRQIILEHGGNFYVGSESSAGASFMVELPREPRAAGTDTA